MGRMDPREFYDDLADDYHLIYDDWRRSVVGQGEALDRLIRAEIGGPCSILDASCGIGTQAIGLALRGHRVTGTDLSPRAVERAAREAALFGVSIATGVADLRTLAIEETFDAAISCDNALPHFETDDEWLDAFRALRARLRPGGLLLVSIRDYDEILKTRAPATVPHVYDGGDRIVFQVWDWLDDRLYRFQHFLLRKREGQWVLRQRTARYRGILREETAELARAAGYGWIRWLLPANSGYYQPVLLARKL